MSAIVNKELVDFVKSQIANQAMKILNQDALALLVGNVDRFPMGPDAYADIARMPRSVTDLKSWIAFLDGVKKAIDDDNAKGRSIQRDANNQIVGAHAEYMVDGRLRAFKTGICILHGLVLYFRSLGNVLPPSTLQQVHDGATAYCRLSTTRPDGISIGGSKLWEKVFDPSNIRASNYLALVISWTLTPIISEAMYVHMDDDAFDQFLSTMDEEDRGGAIIKRQRAQEATNAQDASTSEEVNLDATGLKT